MNVFNAPDVDIANIVNFEPLRLSVVSPAGRWEMPWRWRLRCWALRLRFGMGSFRQPQTSSDGRNVRLQNSTMTASAAGIRTVLFRLRSHGNIGGLARLRRLRKVFDIETILDGEEAGRRLRRFEFGSNSLRHQGAAVKNACHKASAS